LGDRRCRRQVSRQCGAEYQTICAENRVHLQSNCRNDGGQW
jgi:hypothetical protein